jgi:hypothetical protein
VEQGGAVGVAVDLGREVGLGLSAFFAEVLDLFADRHDHLPGLECYGL